MLVYEDEPGRKVFAVYVRGPNERGEINFYPTQEAAQSDVGPGMPEGIITHGDTYIEYIGDALLYAPADWPLTGVNQDLLVQLQADDFEIFLALTASESDALTLLMSGEDEDGGASALSQVTDLEDAEDLIDAPVGITGTQPCAIWMPDGTLNLFAAGADGGGTAVAALAPRPAFDDEIATDRAVVCLLDSGWVPLFGDPLAWQERDDYWVINIQRRVDNDDELFFGRYTADDRSLVVTRSGADTEHTDEHLQLVVEDISCDFEGFETQLSQAGWLIDLECEVPAETSVHPELSESPGWYPAEIDEGIEWICALTRTSPS